jgi:hypothetical protein
MHNSRARSVPVSTIRSSSFDDQLDQRIIKKRMTMSELPTLFQMIQEDENPNTAPIFDQFLIVGADPLHFNPSPKLLMAFPGSSNFLSPQELERLPAFCFPHGFSRVSDDKYLEQFVFEIGAQSNPFRIFGICSLSSFRNCEKTWFTSEFSKDYPICLCFLTRNPLIATSFHILYFLARALAGTVPTLTAHSARGRAPEVREVIAGMTGQGGALKVVGMTIPAAFLRELSFFSSIVPRDAVKKVALAKTSVMSIPNLCHASKCVFYASLDLLFSCLSVEHIVQAVSVFLLERQIAFVASDIHRLTLAMLCVRALTEPFRYRGAFLPVLPDREEYREFLDAPTPFVVGVLRASTIRIPGHVCVIDLDADTIVDPDQSPMLAGADSLIRRLRVMMEKWAPTVALPPKQIMGPNGVRVSNQRYALLTREKKSEFASLHSYFHCERKWVFTEEHVAEIASAFAETVAPTLEAHALLCFVTDRTDERRPVTVFNKELFFDCIPTDAREFYLAFSQTTMFQEFIDKKMDEKSRALLPEIDRCPHDFPSILVPIE